MGYYREVIDVKDLLFRTPIYNVYEYFSPTGAAYVRNLWKGNDKRVVKKRSRHWVRRVGVSCFQKGYAYLIVNFYFINFILKVEINKFSGDITEINYIKDPESYSRPIKYRGEGIDQNKTLADYIKDAEKEDDDSGVS